ncbi:hypothetical protein N665_2526s0002 [Sinapis alba]|nr:hypothetical protein N665_2526s0002 [Sinapis alba]
MWRVKVKIIRLWRQYSAGSGESIEMVFVDARRDKIHGAVKEDEVRQFSNVLIQGQTKVLINFTVTHSGGSYRSTRHPYKVVFLPTTRVRICEALPNNLTGIEPVNYRDVLNGRLDSDFLVHVIGQVVEVSHIEVVAVNGKDTQKITVELRNEEDERLSLVLWGKFAADIIAEIESDMGWYYLSCKVCAKKVLTVPNDTVDDDNEDNVTYTPKLLRRYKLHLVMLDNTANCKFLLFDNLALQLFHTPCIELTGPITDEIGIEREKFLYKHDTFKVLKIITNIAMINEFDSTTSPVISESNDLTPAKRIRPPIFNLEEAFDQNSVNGMAPTIKVKKEKIEESG